ncbi:MAG: lysylphosphatidylglycerol synthase transmembrane domain-containing protein [Pirellulaceae bacterium]
MSVGTIRVEIKQGIMTETPPTQESASAPDTDVATAARGRRVLLGVIKLAAAVGLVGYLLHRAWQSDQFDVLSTGRVQWQWFILGCCLTLGGILLTFERWFWLTREIGAPMNRFEAYRLSFIGYVLNFVTVGTVGGDAFRAVAVAAQDRSKASEGVASVIYDRAVGMVALFLLAAVALFSLDLSQITGDDLVRRGVLEACRGIALVAAIVGVVALVILAWLPKGRVISLVGRVTRLPVIGRAAGPMAMAMLAFAGHRKMMLASLTISLPVHIVNALAVVAVASALPIERPSIMAHLATVPLAHLAGVLPLPGGIGAFEGALGWLYEAAAESEAAGRYGLVVAFGVRLTMLLVALIGIVVYLAGRRTRTDLGD